MGELGEPIRELYLAYCSRVRRAVESFTFSLRGFLAGQIDAVFHRFGNVVVARELRALFAHPAFQVGDQRRAELPADGSSLFGGLAIDRTLDLEQRVDALNYLKRNR
jgi:hypothetical protein